VPELLKQRYRAIMNNDPGKRFTLKTKPAA
jgi:hypothetical protein